MRRFRSLKPMDWVAFVMALGVFGTTLGFAFDHDQGQQSVYIESADDEWIYPLDANVMVTVRGALGVTHVHIEDMEVFVSDSPCNEKICVAASRISRTGAWIACLPNKVFIRIEGDAAPEVDGIAF